MHYLRTTNPLNPENLAVYPRRHRHQPPERRTRSPGAFNKLAQGLRSTRTATAPQPGPRRLPRSPPSGSRSAPTAVARAIGAGPPRAARTGSTSSPSPSAAAETARRRRAGSQAPVHLGGETTQYPHVGTAAGCELRAPGLPRDLSGCPGTRADRAGRGPAAGAVLAVVPRSRVAGGVLALRLEPSAATDTLVGRAARFAATEPYSERFGDEAVFVLVRGELPRARADREPRPLLGLEGCLSGNVPAGQAPPGGVRLALRPAGARPSRRRSSSALARSSTRRSARSRTSSGPLRSQARRGRAGGARRAAGRARARASAGRAEAVRRAGRAARPRPVRHDLLQISLRYGLGLDRAPAHRRPGLRLALVFDATRGAGDAEGALRLHLPAARRR